MDRLKPVNVSLFQIASDLGYNPSIIIFALFTPSIYALQEAVLHLIETIYENNSTKIVLYCWLWSFTVFFISIVFTIVCLSLVNDIRNKYNRHRNHHHQHHHRKHSSSEEEPSDENDQITEGEYVSLDFAILTSHIDQPNDHYLEKLGKRASVIAIRKYSGFIYYYLWTLSFYSFYITMNATISHSGLNNSIVIVLEFLKFVLLFSAGSVCMFYK
jgi:hypothetical protein